MLHDASFKLPKDFIFDFMNIHFKALYFILCYMVFLTTSAQQNLKESCILKKAGAHSIQYYISLPEGWNKKQQWPIVISAEAADKKFKANAVRFAEARKDLPFIIVVPIIVTNGNYGIKDHKIYPYSNDVWDEIDKKGACWFDETGILAILKDVKKQYNGSDKIFMTGFEAGAHIVWTMLFNHPQIIKAAAPVAGNYIGRCVNADQINKTASGSNTVIKAFYGQQDQLFGLGGTLYKQWLQARDLAIKNGYKNISEVSVAHKGHEPMPAEVLAWFQEIINDHN